jgi:hypothetical protein
MRTVGWLLAGVVLATAAHSATASWIGTWGYVALPPPPGEPILVAAAAPAPSASPMGGFTPVAVPAPRPAALHAIRIIGATLTPYQGSFYTSPAGEIVRQALNHWIRSSGEFDGVIDFEQAVADPDNPLFIDRRYNESDHLHPNDAGYKVMGNAIDLSLIVK